MTTTEWDVKQIGEQVAQKAEPFSRLLDQMHRVIVGQDAVIEQLCHVEVDAESYLPSFSSSTFCTTHRPLCSLSESKLFSEGQLDEPHRGVRLAEKSVYTTRFVSESQGKNSGVIKRLWTILLRIADNRP